MLPSGHDDDRLCGDAGTVPSDRPPRLVRGGGSDRLRGRVHGQRALPSLDPAAGPERLRLVVHGRARPADEPPLRDGGDVPWVPLPPGGDRACGGDARGDVPRALLPRSRRGRGAQRARRRRRLAGDRHPQRDAVRVDRDHQQAVHRQGRQAQGRVLHARERPPLHDPGRGASRPRLRRDRRSAQRQEDRQVRGRDHHGRRRRREDRDALGQVRGRGEGGRQGRHDLAEAAPDPRVLGAHGRRSRPRTR